MTDLIHKIYNIAEAKNIGAGDIFEQIVKTSYLDIIKAGDKVIDIGAHVGFHLFPMAEAVGEEGQVYAFEPLPDLFSKLKKQIKKRNVSNIKLYDQALGVRKKVTTFQCFSNFPAYSGLQRRQTPFDDTKGGLETITVKQNRLDSVLGWFTKVSFIKLDIEGGELHALMGGLKTLKRSRPIIIFENGCQSSADIYHYSKDEFFKFFEELDMSIYTLTGNLFTRAEWYNPGPCWEFVALPNEQKSVSKKFSEYCKLVIDSY